MVQHLKQQVAELKEELSLATGGEEREGELDTTERDGYCVCVRVCVCKKILCVYVCMYM